DRPAPMLAAASRVRERHGLSVDAHTPFPIHGLDEALGLHGSRIPFIGLVGALCGAGAGYLMQWWCNAIDFPINVGGRPLNSALSFVPITFELGVLICALSMFLGFFAIIRLPRLHHPIFEAEGFSRASLDTFWLSVCGGEVTPEQRDRLSQELRDL